MIVSEHPVGGLPAPSCTIRYVESGADLAELDRWLAARRDGVLGLDLEWNARDQWRPDYRLRTVQMADMYESWVVPVWSADGWFTCGATLAHLIRRHPRWCAHFSEADTRSACRGLPTYRDRWHIREAIRWEDAEPHVVDTQTLLAMYDPRTVTTTSKKDRIDVRIPHLKNLKESSARVLTPSLQLAERELHAWFRSLAPVGQRTPEASKRWGFANADVSHQVFRTYAGLDPLVGVRLYHLLRAELERRGQWGAACLSLREQWMCDRMTYLGMSVDPDYATWFAGELERVVDREEPHLVERGINRSGMGPAVGRAMEAIGEPVRRWNVGDNGERTPSWNKHAMEQVLADGGPGADLAERLTLVRRSTKFRGVFVEPMLRTVAECDGRMHGSMRSLGTVTTRMSAQKTHTSGPLHQAPKRNDQRTRGCVVAPHGWALVSADFEQGEPYTMAMLSGDPAFLAALLEPHPALGKPDLNSVVASTIYGEVYDARQGKVAGTPSYDMRQRAKFGFLAWCYACMARKLAELLGVTVEVAQRAIDTWRSLWPRFARWQDECNRQAVITLPTGHLVPLWDRWYVDDQGELRPAARDSRLGPNADTQGTQRQLLGWAMHRVEAWGWGWAMRFALHDELLLCVPAWMAEQARLMLEAAMTLTWRGVTVRCEATIEGRSWLPQVAHLDTGEIMAIDDEEESV